MASQIEGDSRKHADAQDSTSVSWHLYHIHAACFVGRTFSKNSLDDIRIFRECIARLPRSEMTKIVTTIQTCIDGCPMNAESASQRLRLLQDISSWSGLFPASYWISDITKGKKISVGGEATVYLGHHGGEAIVVREFHPVDSESGGFDEARVERMKKIIIREIIAHWQLRHPNIVAVIGIHLFDGESIPSMILRRAEHSSAIKYLELNPDPPSFLKLLLGLFDAIHYLHARSPPIIHGDIHDRNVVISSNGDCLLCDFGLSRIRYEISRTHTTIHQGGRQRFIAPEITSGREGRVNEKSDIYALAMTVYALGTRSLPFGHIGRDAAACRVARKGERPPKCDSLGGLTREETERLWSLMERMWDRVPQGRPMMSSARDEMVRIAVTCLELTAVPIAASSTPPTPTISLHSADRIHRQVSASSDVDLPIGDAMLVLGERMQDHPKQERGSETTRPNKYLYEELSALALSEPSHANERASTSMATSVTGPANETRSATNTSSSKLHTSNAASQHPASIRSSAFSPSPQPLSPQFSKNTISPANNPVFQASRNPRYQLNMQQISSAQASRGVAVTAPSNNKGRMSVGVDFGTMFSSVSYGSSRIASGTVQQILIWPGASENFRKIPTCLLYDEGGRVAAWGLEAKYASPTPGTIRCEWFQLLLEPQALRDESAVDSRLPTLPPGKRAIDLIVDFLSCLWNYAREQITREIGAVADLNAADVWLTVPAAWDAKGCQIMRDGAIQAGLVAAAFAGDRTWRDRLHIITEPEAAAVHCAHLANLHHLRPSQNFMICDTGGGTVDLAVYKIIGSLQNLEIAEVCARSGSNCGSLFLDLRFRELVRTLLADHPVHLEPASLAYFMHAFSETDRLAYMGESDDANMFHFTCFNVEDPDDANVGLVNGELAVPGYLLRREVFDPVVEQVLNLIEEQTRKVEQRIDVLLLVGGFSCSEYLFKRVDETFGSRIKVIARPADADTVTCRGAAQYGLARRPLVSSVIAPKSYIMRVKLPAEAEDWQRRPAYIRENNAGVNICKNRLQYLVSKGAILRKGQRVRTKLCKFSKYPQDRLFVAVLYTSDSDKIMRYTDEGEMLKLCKFTVDLAMLPLPSFQQHTNKPGGFYTDFEIGLELDGAEVGGALLYDGYECGRITFDFLL